MEEEDVVGSRSRATIDKSDMRGFCCTQFTIRLHSALCTLHTLFGDTLVLSSLKKAF